MVGDRHGALHLYRSNRVEALAEVAADLFATPAPGAGPFDPEHVVVQGRGMAVWFSMQLCRRHGIWAGGNFLYPRNFVQHLFERVVGSGVSSAYDRRELMWSVLALLGEEMTHPELGVVARYVAKDASGVRCHQLARRIADTFDQYATYRPDWVRAWERGEPGPIEGDAQLWQATLWRMLVARLGTAHAAGLERSLLEMLSGRERIEGLPQRIAVFGIASLPPMYVRILAALSRHVEVHWFLPSPATGYWADFAPAERVARAGEHAEVLHLHSGHPLLASLGRLGAELQVVLTEELEALGVTDDEPGGDLHVAPATTTVLGRLQYDILHAAVGAYPQIQAGDRSIALHACHGPMREVEVLHDQLLDLIVRKGVSPHEIVVMTPDVEAYAPLIESVFDREPADPRFIPYRIADRHLRRDSPLVDAFLRTLDLVNGRAPVSAVLDLLALGPVHRRFGIAPEDIDTVRRWIAESGIRWGIDEEHRQAAGLPKQRANTWRFGLERMLLGYAMPSGGRTMFEGTLAYDEIEGQDAVLLGKLATFCDSLFAVMRSLEAPLPVTAHATALTRVLDAMLAVETHTATEHRLLRNVLQDITASAEVAGFEEEVGIDVMRALLDEMVEKAEPARGFLAGGVTFCAMVPMRNIPFRVVALIGLSDQAFPRTRRPLDFDLMAMRQKGSARRAGDRSIRDDDRYLFLEAMLAAREHALLIYTGQSVRDGAALAPSVVVSELLDALQSSHPEIDIVHRLVTHHPLQPFSPRYFDDSQEPNLFSYSGEYGSAAQRLEHGRTGVTRPFFDGALPPPDGMATDAVALGELLRFFEAPLRYLMTRRLGVDLRDFSLSVAEREPIELDHLEQWAVGDQLLSLRLDGVDIADTEALARATGVLPLGTLGTLAHRQLLAEVEPIAERVRGLRGGGRAPDLVVSARLADGTLISGEVGERWQRGQLRHQFSRVGGKQLVALWIRHLMMCWQGDGEGESFLVGRAPAKHKQSTLAYRLAPVADPEAHLRELVALYFRGLREPLRLFPKAGFVFAQQVHAGKSEEQALRAARQTYQQEELKRDPHIQRVFGTEDVIFGDGRDGFAALSRAVMLPLVERLQELR